MSKQMGIRFHPTDTELINYLKRFFKGELCLNQQCPIQFADIYGDQPPWEIFGANFEEKFRYFITPLKKRRIKDTRFSRTCAKGTWKGQTGEELIRRNSLGPVVGFKRKFRFETSDQCGQNKTWLMIEYQVADSFFKENKHILKEDFVVCQIKKKKIMDKEKNADHVIEAQAGDVAGSIDPMLLEPNHNNVYSTREDQVRVCDEVEATTTEFDVRNTMEKRETALEVQQGNGVDDIRSNEFQEMYKVLEDFSFDIPDEWLQNSHILQDI
ncbi:NAC domain-containing protein 1-like [Solanum pennellii]|uniref:NAC domain-containing protein 1-like n=1 Tax=Solanum pennellii TaxID=28526 RepID=A0ABM1GC08_SOLPN|nr:NAC domain-containing protein 1-like [Solanum pennellii]